MVPLLYVIQLNIVYYAHTISYSSFCLSFSASRKNALYKRRV